MVHSHVVGMVFLQRNSALRLIQNQADEGAGGTRIFPPWNLKALKLASFRVNLHLATTPKTINLRNTQSFIKDWVASRPLPLSSEWYAS